MQSKPAFSVLLLAVLVLAACSKGEPQAQGGGPRGAGGPGGGGDRPVTVTTQVLQLRSFNDIVQALGTVRARESVTVTAKVSETVQRVHFQSGDIVRAGQPLITLSGQAQQAGLVEAETAVREAERLFARQSELAAQQLIARSALDTQRAARDSARARAAQVRATLADRVIRAPFSGVLGLRQVSTGALVTPGTPIATLDDIARVYVDFPVPEAQLANLAAGQQLRGTTVAFPGRRFEGEVSIVDARVDPSSRSVVVRGDFPNTDRALRPGMLMKIELERPARPALLVPEIAIVQVGRDSFVYRAKADGTAEQVPVDVGARRDGLAEVTRGLAVGDRIVIDGTGKLRPGAKIVATARSATPPATPATDSPAPTAVTPPVERTR